MPLIPSDQDRLDTIIAFFRLSRPNDPTGEFTFSKKPAERELLAEFLIEIDAPLFLIRTVFDAPAGHRVVWIKDGKPIDTQSADHQPRQPQGEPSWALN